MLYIFECDVGQSYREGVRMIPLEHKLERYKGLRTGAVRRLNKSISVEVFLRYAKEYLDVDFDGTLRGWWGIRGTSSEEGRRREMFCSELVVEMLKLCEVITEDSPISSSFTPQALFDLDSSILRTGWGFLPPAFFSWDSSVTHSPSLSFGSTVGDSPDGPSPAAE